MFNPKITVIINSYNYAEYVAETIESAIDQDYGNKEIIVIDDGSTDDSKEVIEKYSDRVTTIFQENQGQIKACLHAISLSSGEYIYFLDSDDYLLPGALSKIAERCAPEVSKIQFQLTPVNSEGEVVGKPFPRMKQESSKALINETNKRGSYNSPPNSGNVYRRDTFNYIGNIDYEASIDGIPYLISPFIGKVEQINQPLGCYRYHTRNYSEHGLLRAGRFRAERERFVARLRHLAKIAASYNFKGFKIKNPEDFSHVYSRKMLEAVSDNKAPSLGLAFKYGFSLLREGESLGRLLQLWTWSIATCILPNNTRRWLAIYFTYPLARKRAKAG